MSYSVEKIYVSGVLGPLEQGVSLRVREQYHVGAFSHTAGSCVDSGLYVTLWGEIDRDLHIATISQNTSRLRVLGLDGYKR